jgi:peptide methionine sulfoxide reductase MsrA
MSRRLAISFLLPLLSPSSLLSQAWTAMVPPSSRPHRRHPSIDRGAAGGGAGRAAPSPRGRRIAGGSERAAAREDEDDERRRPRRTSSRRSFLERQAAAIAAAASAADAVVVRPGLAAADAAVDDEMVDVYFGCGCFWHVQHEFVEAERRILGRADAELTSRAGYAGGRAGSKDGRVCYHNARDVADYGKLGHAEVVSLRVPSSKFGDFAAEYCRLFDGDGFRPDQGGDRGPEYRNLVGIPGGRSSPLAAALVKASVATGDKLDFAVGKGDDGDVPKVSFIMDTADFPFYVAEQYHQFHDGFRLDEGYPESYNSLARTFASKGENFGTCPNGMLGIGIGGL